MIDSPTVRCAIEGLDETPEVVQIAAVCREPFLGPTEGAAHMNVFEIELKAPLGSRAVLDGAGRPGVLCDTPAPDCHPLEIF